MKFQIFKLQKEKGFRINLVDLVFIGLLIGFSIFIYHNLGSLGYYFVLPLYVGFTFFLFCNVFRLRTKSEFIWTFIFLSTVIITLNYLPESWVLYTIVFSFLVQVILIGMAMLSRDYRGVGAK